LLYSFPAILTAGLIDEERVAVRYIAAFE